jgi:hypothetical protein
MLGGGGLGEIISIITKRCIENVNGIVAKQKVHFANVSAFHTLSAIKDTIKRTRNKTTRTSYSTILKLQSGDVRAESALHTSALVRINFYAQISQIRCPWNIASCNGPRYRTKRDIY